MPYKNPEDQKAYAKKHYEANKELYKARAVEHKRVAIDRNRKYVYKYLTDHPCVDCGESDPIVLQFDHDFSRKEIAVSEAVTRAWSLERLKKEIDKCEVRCANCHTRKTADQWGYYTSAGL